MDGRPVAVGGPTADPLRPEREITLSYYIYSVSTERKPTEKSLLKHLLKFQFGTSYRDSRQAYLGSLLLQPDRLDNS